MSKRAFDKIKAGLDSAQVYLEAAGDKRRHEPGSLQGSETKNIGDRQTQNREQLYFDAIKEDRGSYFVEYHPPVANSPFATLNLVFSNKFELTQVCDAMQTEMRRWLERYPVPIMTSAFDITDSVIQPNGAFDDAFLCGWLEPTTHNIASCWKLNELPASFNDTSHLPDWRTIYKDVSFRTDTQVKAAAQKYLEKTRKQNLTLKIIITLWLAVIPAAWATIQYFGPDWLAVAVLIYALWRAYRTWRKLMGRSKPSPSEEKRAEKERKMDHYYYHCERNPDGFARLKIENFKKDISERTRKEAEDLAKK